MIITHNYGLELVAISKGLRKLLDIRQGILIKSSLGLSKFSRTRPLLDALKVNSMTQLYFKFKLLFYRNVSLYSLASLVFSELKEHYSRFKKPSLSYFAQCEECSKVMGCDMTDLNRNDLPKKLNEKFGSPDLELVDSIRDLLYNYDIIPEAKVLLRELVWVDFYA
jgi:hypothetical protein